MALAYHGGVVPTRASTRIVAKSIFPVGDMAEAAAFYRGLGFEVEAFDDGYAWVRHDDEEILHLRLVPELDSASNKSAGYFHVADADSWHTAWAEGEVALSDIEDRPWGMREFSFSDPSGNLIRVGHNL
jgi:catechol 2,3-dioxygenase-like lactoylglutathione lyase family enzyme